LPNAGNKESAGILPSNGSRGRSRIGMPGCAFKELFDVDIAIS